MTIGKPIVGYIRVSTQKQGDSGLGLEAQQEALKRYAQTAQGKVLRVYKEIESGRKKKRPELLKAIAHARRSGATLVIAKLDRLSRDAAFLFTLQDSGLDFVCCDNPHANKLTIRILAVVAQDEAEKISQRTKEALAAYKARGGKLGGARPECRNLTQEARLLGATEAALVIKAKADAAYADLVEQLHDWRNEGMTLQAIADALNIAGHTTRRGKAWNPVQVMRVLERS